WSPVWSPDGKFIYFSSDRGTALNLWRIAVDESSGAAGGAPEPPNDAAAGGSRDRLLAIAGAIRRLTDDAARDRGPVFTRAQSDASRVRLKADTA
ncbi:MAG: TolB family protein, partial [Vicinamibacterales bacterium]